MKRQLGILCAAIVSLGVILPRTAESETLVYEGFSANDYNISSANLVATSGPTAANDSIGTSTAKWVGGTSQVYVYTPSLGLDLPIAMKSKGFTSTGGSIGTNPGSNNSGLRALYHNLATDVLKKSAGNTFYVRLLVNIDSTAAGKLAASTAVSNGDGAYYGFGICKNNSKSSYAFTHSSSPSALGFIVWKNKSNQYVLSLALTSSDGNTSTQYTLIEDITLGSTYVCYAEVEVGAGTDGEETIRAGAMVSDEYTTALVWQQTSISFDLMTDSVYPADMAIAGPYGSNNGYFRGDELRIGTEIGDVLAVATGGPSIDTKNTTLSTRKDDGSYDVTVALSQNSGTVKAIARTSEDDDSPIVVASAEPVTAGGSATLNLSGFVSDKTYSILAAAENDSGVETNSLGSVYSGVLTLSKVRDADEATLLPAIVRLSRAAADPYDLYVSYSLASATAVAGVNYVVPSGTAVIPANSTSIDVELTPVYAGTLTEDATVTFTFATKSMTSVEADQQQDVVIVRNLYDLSRRYVDCTVSGGGQRAGTDWEDAYASIVDAYNAVKAVKIPATIYVKPGTYDITSQLVLDNAYAIVGVEGDTAEVTIRNTTKYVSQTDSVDNRVITLNHASALLANVTVTGGAPNGYGLNILISSNGGTVSNCISHAAFSPYYSAASSVYLNGSNALLTHSVVDGVTCAYPEAGWDGVSVANGMGVHVAKGRVENTLVSNVVAKVGVSPSADPKNTTAKKRVGGIFVDKGAIARNCTVANCHGSCGGGIYAVSGATVENCVAIGCYMKGIWEVDGPEVDTLNDITAVDGSTVVNCATDESTPVNDTCVIGTTNSLFTAYSEGNLLPKSNGPLHDAGMTPTGWAKGDGRTDLAGKQRFAGKAIDIGAYELPPPTGLIIFCR